MATVNEEKNRVKSKFQVIYCETSININECKGNTSKTFHDIFQIIDNAAAFDLFILEKIGNVSPFHHVFRINFM